MIIPVEDRQNTGSIEELGRCQESAENVLLVDASMLHIQLETAINSIDDALVSLDRHLGGAQLAGYVVANDVAHALPVVLVQLQSPALHHAVYNVGESNYDARQLAALGR